MDRQSLQVSRNARKGGNPRSFSTQPLVLNSNNEGGCTIKKKRSGKGDVVLPSVNIRISGRDLLTPCKTDHGTRLDSLDKEKTDCNRPCVISLIVVKNG